MPPPPPILTNQAFAGMGLDKGHSSKLPSALETQAKQLEEASKAEEDENPLINLTIS